MTEFQRTWPRALITQRVSTITYRVFGRTCVLLLYYINGVTHDKEVYGRHSQWSIFALPSARAFVFFRDRQIESEKLIAKYKCSDTAGESYRQGAHNRSDHFTATPDVWTRVRNRNRHRATHTSVRSLTIGALRGYAYMCVIATRHKSCEHAAVWLRLHSGVARAGKLLLIFNKCI